MTSAAEHRLEHAGVALPDVPAPVAVHVPAARVGPGRSAAANRGSELLGPAFGDRGRRAKSPIGVAALPPVAPAEVDLVVEAA